jgi:hypothetical protein
MSAQASSSETWPSRTGGRERRAAQPPAGPARTRPLLEIAEQAPRRRRGPCCSEAAAAPRLVDLDHCGTLRSAGESVGAVTNEQRGECAPSRSRLPLDVEAEPAGRVGAGRTYGVGASTRKLGSARVTGGLWSRYTIMLPPPKQAARFRKRAVTGMPILISSPWGALDRRLKARVTGASPDRYVQGRTLPERWLAGIRTPPH